VRISPVEAHSSGIQTGYVAGGAGTANLIFNHNEAAYNFASNIGGTIARSRMALVRRSLLRVKTILETTPSAWPLESPDIFAFNVIISGGGNYPPGRGSGFRARWSGILSPAIRKG